MTEGFILFDTKIDVTPVVRGSFEEVDVSQWLPAEATGVILHACYGLGAREFICVRKKGSTDDFSAYSKTIGTNLLLCGIDDEKIFEAFVGVAATAKLYLIGYTDASVVFLTNASSRIITTLNKWIDINAGPDVPAEATGVIGLMVCEDPVAGRTGYIRQKNSTNDFDSKSDTTPLSQTVMMCGLTLQLFQQYLEGATTNKFYIIGYTLAPVTLNMNCTDISIDAVDEWKEVSTGLSKTVTSSAIEEKPVAIISANNQAVDEQKFKFRKIGESPTLEYDDDEGKLWYDENRFYLVALDDDGKFEAKISHLSIKIYLHGFILRTTAITTIPQVKAVLQITETTWDTEIGECITSANALVDSLLKFHDLTVPAITPQNIADARAHFAAWLFRRRRDPVGAEAFWAEANRFLQAYIDAEKEIPFKVSQA